MDISFNEQPLGVLTEENLKKFWGNVTNIKGVSEGRCQIIEVEGERALQVTFPKGKLSPSLGGASWRYRFDKTYEELTVEYKVRLSSEFDFVRGGKLPGLCGGSYPRGGAREKESDGFSARIMWRELGALMQYVYRFDESSTRKSGQDFLWTSDKRMGPTVTADLWKQLQNRTTKIEGLEYLSPNVWHTLKTHIKMNMPGQENGKIISSFDEREVLNIDLSLRKDASFGIDSFQFVTYFGGNDETWVPIKDEQIFFKDFRFISGE
ncbi:MAG: hypothetical protein JWO00_305 [Candidatus Parcubacteria bacterium]|nr:hypothetical protein [Candidatus Parcubacteria bacterium]